MCVKSKYLSNILAPVSLGELIDKITILKIKKTNISIHSLHKYQEILLVGSGKGVISLSSIPQLRWRVKSDLIYQELKNLYKQIL